MDRFLLRDALRAADGTYQGADATLCRPIANVTIDSRKAGCGSLFAAIPGSRVDGHDFIPTALSKGALAALGEKPMPDSVTPYIQVEHTEKALGKIALAYRRTMPATVIGVTGSVGKTTAKEMLHATLSAGISAMKTEGNLNNQLGVPLSLLRIGERHKAAIIEMGISHFGEMAELAAIAEPDMAVYTTIGKAHLEFLGDLNGVLKAKTEMVPLLPPEGVVFLNGDDPYLAAYQPPNGLKTVYAGIGDGCDVQALDVTEDSRGVSCTIGGRIFRIRSWGRYLASTMALCYAVGQELGLSPAVMADGMLSWEPLPGRGRITETPRITVVDHSYNANPTSMLAALSSLAQAKGRKVAILGDMLELGENSAMLHGEVGRAAKAEADVVIAVGSESRALAAAAESGHWFADADAAMEALPHLLQTGDTVLVKASNSMGLSRLVNACQNL